jgi:hypothetical protein
MPCFIYNEKKKEVYLFMLILVEDTTHITPTSEKKVPTYFRKVEDCISYLISCSSPIKIFKAILVYLKGFDEEDKSKALVTLGHLACQEAYDNNMSDQVLFIANSVSTIAKSLGFIERTQKYVFKPDEFIEV